MITIDSGTSTASFFVSCHFPIFKSITWGRYLPSVMGWWLDTLIAEVTTLAIRGDDDAPVKILGLRLDPEIVPCRLWRRSSRNATPFSSKQKISGFKTASDVKDLQNKCL